MKVIFLDFDGVINSNPFLIDLCDKKIEWGSAHISTDMVKIIDELCFLTGAKVVISSTWRLFVPLKTLSSWLREHGFNGEVIDKTQSIPREPRGKEIASWLYRHDVESFVIFDDCDEMDGLHEFFVQTDQEVGVTIDDMEKAIRILNKATKGDE
jgi:hypothetical protein